MLGKRDSLYYFVQFVFQIKNMSNGIKKANKFESKKSNLCNLYICRSNNYYETFIDNISLGRLKTKISLLLNTF